MGLSSNNHRLLVLLCSGILTRLFSIQSAISLKDALVLAIHSANLVLKR